MIWVEPVWYSLRIEFYESKNKSAVEISFVLLFCFWIRKIEFELSTRSARGLLVLILDALFMNRLK